MNKRTMAKTCINTAFCIAVTLVPASVLAVRNDSPKIPDDLQQAREIQSLIQNSVNLLAQSTPADHTALASLFNQAKEIYRADPTGTGAFEALLFAYYLPNRAKSPNEFIQVLQDKKEILTYLRKYYIDSPRLHFAINLAPNINIVNFSSEYEQLLKAAIKSSPYKLVRASARISLADGYRALSVLLVMLSEFEIDFDTYTDGIINLQLESGQSPSINLINEILNKKAMEWRTNLNWRELQEQARALLVKALQEAPDAELFQYNYNDGFLNAVPAGTISQRATEIQYYLDNLSAGTKLPSIDTATDLNGKPVKLSEHQGKVLVLDFWATWCPPCVASIPHHRELLAKMAGRPFELITLSVDDDPEDVLEFIKDTEMPFTNWMLGIDNPIIKKWRISNFPTIIVVDADGVICTRVSGTVQGFGKYIDKLVSAAEHRNSAGN